MRAFLSCTLGLLLCCGLSAQEKKGGESLDAKNLLGKWELKGAKDRAFTIEFQKGGTAALGTGPKNPTVTGNYTLDGNKLTTTFRLGGDEQKRVQTITKLTDTELVTKDGQGREETLGRIKEK